MAGPVGRDRSGGLAAEVGDGIVDRAPDVSMEPEAGEAEGTTLAGDEIATIEECIGALRALSASDLQQLNNSARMRAAGLELLEGDDLVNEAIARLLSGSRRWPRKVPLVAFLLQTMRSIANSHWKRLERPKEVRESALVGAVTADVGDHAQ